MTGEGFWQALDHLAAQCEVVIDRPRGSVHPRYHDFVYPLDYGYLAGTASMDGGGIDIWRGTDPAGRIEAIVCIVDLAKRDSEIKILIGCTEEEMRAIQDVHNATDFMKGILVRR